MNKQHEALQSVMAYFNKDEVTVPQELYEQVFNSLLDETEPSPVEDVQSNDMTAKEFFDSPESPITLDKICSPVEKEFLLDTIEMYAKGKVHQALKGQQTVGEDVQRMAEAYADKHSYQSDKEQFMTTPWCQWNVYKNAFIAGYSAHPPAPAGMEEALTNHLKTAYSEFTDPAEVVKITYAALIESSKIDFIAGFKAASTPPAKDNWVKIKPDADRNFILVTASFIKDYWDYKLWEIKYHDGYYKLLCDDGEEWGPYEDLKADLYFTLPTPPTT